VNDLKARGYQMHEDIVLTKNVHCASDEIKVSNEVGNLCCRKGPVTLSTKTLYPWTLPVDDLNTPSFETLTSDFSETLFLPSLIILIPAWFLGFVFLYFLFQSNPFTIAHAVSVGLLLRWMMSMLNVTDILLSFFLVFWY
jgi:hypothetical protein